DPAGLRAVDDGVGPVVPREVERHGPARGGPPRAADPPGAREAQRAIDPGRDAAGQLARDRVDRAAEIRDERVLVDEPDAPARIGEHHPEREAVAVQVARLREALEARDARRAE